MKNIFNTKHSSVLYIIAGVITLLALSEMKCAGQDYSSIASVSAKSSSWVVTPNKQSSSYLRHRVTSIYRQVINEYNKEYKYAFAIQDSLSGYKTASLRKLEKRCATVAADGGTPYWYSDSADWVFTKEVGDLKLVSVKVSDITGTTAKARVVIDVFGDSDILQNVDLWLVFENGDWYINDFQDDTMKVKGGHTVRDYMKAFIKTHIAS